MNPNTVVTLYATDFDISNRYVVKAESESEALSAVSTFPNKVYPDCYWQRDASAFRATGNINDVKKYNYCTFENNGKLNFAFITDFTYINDDMTLCHIEIDPWLNYAGEYKFNPSPMKRCHPLEDIYSPETINMLAEPIVVENWDVEEQSEGLASEDDHHMYLVTALRTDSFNAMTIDDYWDGLYQLSLNQGVDIIKRWSKSLKSQMTNIGYCGMQPCTSVLNSGTEIGTIIKNFAENGRSSDIICAYHVPKYIDGGGQTGQNLYSLGDPMTPITFNCTWGGYQARWKKTRYSPQFNKLFMNFIGNARELPIELYPPSVIESGEFEFEIIASVGMNGCASMFPKGMKNECGKSNYCIMSPSWDKVQFSTYAIDALSVKNSMLTTSEALMHSATGVATGIMAMANPFTAVSGANRAMNSAISGVAAGVRGNLELEEIAKSGSSVIGAPTNSIAGYNEANPLVKISHHFPSNVRMREIDKFFGTYGYKQDGNSYPIVFGNLPYWNYYETLDVSITGKTVPQKDLIKIINRFNNGIFIFNDIANYKKFNLALENHL